MFNVNMRLIAEISRRHSVTKNRWVFHEYFKLRGQSVSLKVRKLR